MPQAEVPEEREAQSQSSPHSTHHQHSGHGIPLQAEQDASHWSALRESVDPVSPEPEASVDRVGAVASAPRDISASSEVEATAGGRRRGPPGPLDGLTTLRQVRQDAETSGAGETPADETDTAV